MATTPTVNENTAAWLAVSLKDKTGALAVPASTRYRIDCVTTGAVIRDWTAGPTTSSYELQIDADLNEMQSPTNNQELRRVTVEATYGAPGDRVTAEFDYALINLSGV